MGKTDPLIISESQPLIVGDLTLYPNRLQYKNIRCNFSDIQNIGWYWLSQTINLVNTQDVKLSLYVNGLKDPIHIKKSTMYVTPKLVSAYNFIAEKTFESRLNRYLQQFEQRGAFNFQGYTFCSDGRVLSGDKTFYLKNAQFEPFKISISQGGIFSSKAKIDLTIDRDVVLALVNFILKNPQGPEKVRETSRQQRAAQEYATDFLFNLVSLLAKLSNADGKISPEEIEVIKEFFNDFLKLDQPSMAQAISIFNYAKTSAEPFELFARRLKTHFKENNEILVAVVDLLFSVAISDNELSAEEEILIKEAEAIFRVKSHDYSEFCRERAKRQAERHHDERFRENELFKILGLGFDSSPAEIKAEYRRLVMLYHPDKFHHLGPEFQAQAEIKIKEINMAYEYFRRKYAF